MADGNSTSAFPRAYLNTIKEDDSLIVRVNQNNGEIGSRKSGMPSEMIDGNLQIEHVNNRAI